MTPLYPISPVPADFQLPDYQIMSMNQHLGRLRLLPDASLYILTGISPATQTPRSQLLWIAMRLAYGDKPADVFMEHYAPTGQSQNPSGPARPAQKPPG